MSRKLYDENKDNKVEMNYSKWNFVVSLIVTATCIASLCLDIAIYQGINNDSNVNSNTTTEVGETEVDTSALEEVDLPSDTSLVTGATYEGAFAEELSGIGLTLNEVSNIEDYMGVEYDGHIYTLETGTYMEKDVPTNISFEEYALDLKDIEGFSALKGRCNETSDENGLIYTLSDEEEDYFFIRGLKEDVTSEDENTTLPCYVSYFYMSNYEKCKDLGIALGDVDVDTSIKELVDMFGVPTYIDIYEQTGESPYIMMYYAKLDETTYSVNEMSLIFEKEESALNGYYLSEVTVSVF